MYYLKIGRHGSAASASIIYVAVFVVYLMFSLLMAFLFRIYNNINLLSPIFILSSFFIPLVLFVCGNYLVSQINDGEGSFKNVFICTAYSFAPFLLLMPFVVLVSYACTLNEGFIVDLSSIVIIAWTAVYLFIMIQELHNFTFFNALLNVLLTVGAIVIALVGFLIVYLMAKQALTFIADLYREVTFRVL
jgi:hypothetical protein